MITIIITGLKLMQDFWPVQNYQTAFTLEIVCMFFLMSLIFQGFYWLGILYITLVAVKSLTGRNNLLMKQPNTVTI